MSGTSKLTKKELKRLEELKLKLDLQQKKLNTQKAKIAKEKKGLDSEKKKISSEWKKLDRTKKQFADDQDRASKQSLSSNMKNAAKRNSTSNKKFQDQFFDMKKKYESESKKAREYKKKLDQFEVENKVLRNKLKNASGRRRGKKDDPRLRQLIRENRELRKRLRKLMKELNKRRRWYKRAIKIFKKNQDKWIRKQRDTFKGKKFIIKYVFLDDVKYIKQYQKARKGRDKIQFKNRIRVKTKGGGETTIKDVEIIVLDADNDSDGGYVGDDSDYVSGGDDKGGKGKKKKKKKKKGGDGDDDDDDTNDKDGKGKKKKKKKKGGDDDEEKDDKDSKGKKKKKKKKGGKDEADDEDNVDDTTNDDSGKTKKKKKKKGKSAADDEDDIDKFMADMMSEFKMDADVSDDEEDIKSDEEIEDLDEDDLDDDDDDEDNDDEKDDDNDDDYNDDKNEAGLEAQLLYLKQEMDERGNDLEKLKDIMSGDPQDETGDKAKEEIDKLMNDIGQRQDEMMGNLEKLEGDPKDNEATKEGNDVWKGYMLNLSKIVLGNTEEFSKLISVMNDGFLKELNGRIGDLKSVNDIYYIEEDEKIDFNELKGSVNKRHEEISNEIKEKREQNQTDENDNEKDNDKIKQLYDGLLDTNVNWNELVNNSSNMFNESTSAKNKLIQAVMGKYNKLEELLGNVHKLPSTVLF